MLRKALEKAGLDYIPVLSLSFGLEKNPGFHWTVGLIRRLIYGMMYGDLIMNVANQVRPYEVSAGERVCPGKRCGASLRRSARISSPFP